jgi:hypothetical protein
MPRMLQTVGWLNIVLQALVCAPPLRHPGTPSESARRRSILMSPTDGGQIIAASRS